MPRNWIPMQEGCPWSELANLRVPNVKWCEAQVCGWIVEPANTWSNLGYIGVGIALTLLTRRSSQPMRSRVLRFYGPAVFWVGLFSLAFHASYTFPAQILDFVGMYLYAMLLLMMNLLRLGKWPRERPFRRFWAAVLGLTAVTVAADFAEIPIQFTIVVLALVIIFTEVKARALGKSPAQSRYFTAGMILYAVANFFSYLDINRIFCDPHNHWLQGHAIMHLIGAASLVAVFLHYRQFDQELP